MALRLILNTSKQKNSIADIKTKGEIGIKYLELFLFHPVSIQYLPFFKSENKKSVEKRVFLFTFFVEYFDVFLYTSLLPTFFA